MAGNLVETLVGAVVLVVAALFLGFAYNSTNIGAVEGYELLARFEKIDGLSEGADVRLGGIKVGTVVRQELDTEAYLAVVHLSLDPNIELPEDTSAAVVSESLLGGKYMSLTPGGAEEMLEDGDEIQFTQSSVNLEELIGKFMFSTVEEDEDEGANGAAGDPGDAGKNVGDK